MSDEPVNWFYGLMAERVAVFTPEAYQVPFLLRAIERFGQPVLDLGCGTGRLLLPILRAGVDVEGCDISGDMLRHCIDKALRDGFRPHLYEQPMHSFLIPRLYQTIYIWDAFNLAGGREKALTTLKCCFEHLHEGGALIFNVEAEYANSEWWEKWNPTKPILLPEPWPEEGKHCIAADGSEYVESYRLVSTDMLEQTYVCEVRIEKWVSGELAATQQASMHGSIYMKNEVILMLQVAGFHCISVCGDYTDASATQESHELIFTALKKCSV